MAAPTYTATPSAVPDTPTTRYAYWILNNRWLVILLSLVVFGALFASLPMGMMGFKSNYRVFFSEDNPQLATYEAFQRTFSREDNVIIVVKPREGDIFNPRTLQIVQEVTEAAWLTPSTRRVDSLTNYQHTFAETVDHGDGEVEDQLTVRDLVDVPAAELTPAQLQQVREIALGDPLVARRLAPDDGTATGIALSILLKIDEPQEIDATVSYVRALINGGDYTRLQEVFQQQLDSGEVAADALAVRLTEAQSGTSGVVGYLLERGRIEPADAFATRYPDHEFRLSGTIMLNQAFTEASMHDMQTLIPAMFLVLLVCIGIFLRSASGVFATLSVIAVSAGGALGFAAWAGIKLTPPSASAPTVIMTLAIADAMHFLVSMLREMGRGRSKRDAIAESLRMNFLAILTTSLTTAIGFLALNTSDAPPFRDLGNITAVGVVLAWAFSVSLLPALASLLPFGRRAIAHSATGEDRHRRLPFVRFADWVLRHYRVLAISVGGAAALLIAATSRLELNDEFIKYFGESVQFRQDTEFMMDHLTGIYQIELPIRVNLERLAAARGQEAAAEYAGINEPEMTRVVEDFGNWLRTQPKVLHVYSITDIIKRLNKNFNRDDPAFYAIPDSRNLTAQYLFMYDNSMREGMSLTDRISIDKMETRITVTLEDLSSVEMRQFERQWLDHFRQTAPEHFEIVATGPNMMFAYISQRNIEGNLVGTSIGFVLIAMCLAVTLSSLKFGAISLIPNMLPALVTFGLWGLVDGQVNLAVAVVAAVSLGIIADDTVHLLLKYRRGRKEYGYDPGDAIRYAFDQTGPALMITTLVLCAGFGMLAMSDFVINGSMGLLTAVAIAVALAMDFLLLPPLLLYFDATRAERERAAAGSVGSPAMTSSPPLVAAASPAA